MTPGHEFLDELIYQLRHRAREIQKAHAIPGDLVISALFMELAIVLEDTQSRTKS